MKIKNSVVGEILKNLSYFFTYILTLLCFLTIYRGIFLYKNFNETKDIPTTVFFESFLRGVKFDLVIVGYLGFLLLLLFTLSKIILRFLKTNKSSLFFKLFSIISSIMIFLILTIEIVDAELFTNSGEHLSASVLDYLNSMDSGLAGTIWQDYPVIWNIIIVLSSTLLFYYLTNKVLQKIFPKVKSSKKLIISDLVSLVVGAGFCLIFARGGFGVAVINWGYAWFSDYPFANNVVMNGSFSLLKSIDTQRKIKSKGLEQMMPYKKDEWQSLLRKDYQLKDNLVLNSTYANIKTSNPLRRVVDTKRIKKHYNVVIVLLESWMSRYIGSLDGDISATPCFDELQKEGFLFDNIYANGTRSNRGLVSVLCSFPSQSGRSVMKLEQSNSYMFALPDMLKHRGYTTSFIYGGDVSFDNMNGFFKKHGIDSFIGKKDFPQEQYFSKWGVPDKIMLTKALDYFKTQKEPFFTTMFTLSTHEPFDLPDNKCLKFTKEDSKDYKYLNTLNYSDQSLKKFMNNFKKEAPTVYNNTIFVFVADHGRKVRTDLEFDPQRFKIPLLFILPKELKEEVEKMDFNIHSVGAQVDILPSLMHLLGGKYENANWGRSLFARSNNRRAFMIAGSKFVVTDGKYYYYEKVGVKKNRLFTFENHKLIDQKLPEFKMQLKTQCHLYFQASQTMTLKGNYGYKKNH